MMSIFIIIQLSAALIATAKGWGTLPISILGLAFSGSYEHWWSEDTMKILDYVTTILFIYMAVIPAKNATDNNTKN